MRTSSALKRTRAAIGLALLWSIEALAADPVGYQDTVSDSSIVGWACDPDAYSTPLTVDLYATGLYTAQGCISTATGQACKFATVTANQARPDVSASCGGTTAHGYNVPAAAQYHIRKGGVHNVYAIAKNVATGADKQLPHAPTSNAYIQYQYNFSGIDKGGDPGLTLKRVASPGAPLSTNYYCNINDASCGTTTPKPLPLYQIAVQSEALTGGTYSTCAGTTNQSLPVSGWNGGTTQFWYTGSGASLTAHLKTDTNTITHPCTQTPVFNWFVFGDHSGNNPSGPYPNAEFAAFKVTTNYSDWIPSGASRMVVYATGFWHEGTVLVAHDVEIAMNLTNWGDDHPEDPEVIDYRPTPTQKYLHVNGAAMGWIIPKGQASTWRVHWGNVFKHFIDRGYFSAPAGGWPGTGASTSTSIGGVLIGTELMNPTRTGAGVTDLAVSGYYIQQAAP